MRPTHIMAVPGLTRNVVAPEVSRRIRGVFGSKVCSAVNVIRRPTIAAAMAVASAHRGLGSKTFYPPEARAARANLCPFATNARRGSMLWSKVASISCLASTVFHGPTDGRQTRAIRALANGVTVATASRPS